MEAPLFTPFVSLSSMPLSHWHYSSFTPYSAPALAEILETSLLALQNP